MHTTQYPVIEERQSSWAKARQRLAWASMILAFLLAISSTQRSLEAQCNDCWLVAQGTKIVKASNGEEVILRAVGLGGWLLQEGYMLNPSGCAGCPGTQWQMKLQYLNEGKSLEEVEQFYAGWRDNFIQKTDIDYLASLGFNTIRLPMHYELFLTQEQRAVRNAVITNLNQGHDDYKLAMQTWLDNDTLFVDTQSDGFQMIDRILEWCEDNGMYLALDLHAAPGGQGSDLNICDGFHANNLWQFQVFQDAINQLWLSISSRYKNEPRIAMYEFVNEPNNVPGGGPAIHALTQRLISTVRGNGDTHIITVHGNGWGNNYDNMQPSTFSPNWGLVYSAHRYGIDPAIDWIPDGNPNQINRMVDLTNFRDNFTVPVWCGETGENSNEWLSQNIAKLEAASIGWCHWTYKRHDWQENPALMRIGGNWPTDGADFMDIVLESIKFDNLHTNFNTLAAVTQTLPPPGTSGCDAASSNCLPIGRTVWFRGNNGLYVSAGENGSEMTCSLTEVGSLGQFVIEDAGAGKVALRGFNGLYVSCENGEAPMTCNRPTIGAWERFDWVDFGNGSIGIRGINGRYVSSENGAGPMNCDRVDADAWEVFDIGFADTLVSVDSFEVTNGTFNQGDVEALNASDNVDLVVWRSLGDIQSQVTLEFNGTCEFATPTTFRFQVESSVFARSSVNLKIELFDFETESWLLVYSGNASRFNDSTAEVEVHVNPTRFINDSLNVKARCRYRSDNQRQLFGASVDHVEWTLE